MRGGFGGVFCREVYKSTQLGAQGVGLRVQGCDGRWGMQDAGCKQAHSSEGRHRAISQRSEGRRQRTENSWQRAAGRNKNSEFSNVKITVRTEARPTKAKSLTEPQRPPQLNSMRFHGASRDHREGKKRFSRRLTPVE